MKKTNFRQGIFKTGILIAFIVLQTIIMGCSSNPSNNVASTSAVSNGSASSSASTTNNQALNPVEANAEFDKRLKLDPKDLDAKTGKALLLLQSGDDSKAIALLKEVLASNPDHGGANTAYGQLLYDSDRVDEALNAFLKALKAEPSNAQALAGYGRCQLRKGEYEKAISAISQALKTDKDPYLYADRGTAFGIIGQNAPAEADFAIALEALADDPYIYLDRGRMRLRTKKPLEAIADFSKVLEMRPDFTLTYHYRAQAWDAIAKASEAIKDYEAVLAARPDYFPTKEPLAVLYAENNQFEKSSALFQSSYDRLKQNDRYLLLSIAVLKLSPEKAVQTKAITLGLANQKLLKAEGILYQVCRSFVDSKNEAAVLTSVQKLDKGNEKAFAQLLLGTQLRNSGSQRAADDLAAQARDHFGPDSTEGRLAALIRNEPRNTATQSN